MIVTDKRALRGEETYLKIINSTIDIISEQGISGVSAAKVSKGAGISKSSVFHHFQSVDEILTATLNKIIDIMIYETKHEDAHTLADVLDSFECKLFQANNDLTRIEKVFFAFYNESIFCDSYKEVFHGFLKKSIYEFEKILVKVGVENAKQFSQLMIAMLDGLSIQIIITGQKEESYGAWKDFKAMALEFNRKDK